MSEQHGKRRAPLLQVVGPTGEWILERLARRLAAKLPYAEFLTWKPKPSKSARFAYYVNYALYDEPRAILAETLPNSDIIGDSASSPRRDSHINALW